MGWQVVGKSPPTVFFDDTFSQFYQQFTSNFYAHRSQKRKKDSQVKQLFLLLGSVCIKAACKHIDEIDPRSQFYQPIG